MKLFKILMIVVLVGLAASSVALASQTLLDQTKDQTKDAGQRLRQHLRPDAGPRPHA